jgi:hypothetical protein
MELNNLDRLVNWSNKFLGRRDTDRVCQHNPEQNRVTWKTPSSEAFVPLQESIGVLASYVQMQV